MKLGAVARNVVGVSGRRMLEAIKQGESDAQVLAELAKGRLREKLAALRLALDGRVTSTTWIARSSGWRSILPLSLPRRKKRWNSSSPGPRLDRSLLRPSSLRSVRI